MSIFPSPCAPPKRRSSSAAFSLVEILVVVSIMAVLFGLGAAAFRGMSGVSLSTSVIQVQGVLTKGRQIALSSNKYTQVRFYRRANASTPGYHAVALFVGDSPFYKTSDAEYDQLMMNKQFRQEGEIEFLPDTLMIAGGDESKLLEDLATETYRTGTSDLRGEQYNWVSFYFRPNGATDFQEIGGQPHPPLDAFFSVVPARDYEKNTSELPPNFATFTVSSANGALNIIRP